MNLRYLQSLSSEISQIQIIGKSVELYGAINHVMGLIRSGSDLKLLVLHYDDDFVSRIEETELIEESGCSPEIQTNRLRVHGDRSIEPVKGLYSGCRKLLIGNYEFTSDTTEHSRCNPQDWRALTIFTEFLKHGWNPEGLEDRNIEHLFLATIHLEGEYHSIPEVGKSPVLEFDYYPDYEEFLVEEPLRLSFHSEYPYALQFKNKQTSEEHQVLIHAAYPYDIWKEIMKTFDEPSLLEGLSAEQIAHAKAEFEVQLAAICPKGMHFPMIEYECEQELSLQFHSSAWLEAKPVHTHSSIGFLVKPEHERASSGLPMKAAVIQEPISPDTDSIEVELFKCIRQIQREKVTLVD